MDAVVACSSSCGNDPVSGCSMCGGCVWDAVVDVSTINTIKPDQLVDLNVLYHTNNDEMNTLERKVAFTNPLYMHRLNSFLSHPSRNRPHYNSDMSQGIF